MSAAGARYWKNGARYPQKYFRIVSAGGFASAIRENDPESSKRT